MKKGFLITLEGNEGCGNTTQTKFLASYLKHKGRKVYVTREPGGTRIGQAVRRVLLDNKNEKMTPVCETFLYMAARTQLVSEVILEKLNSGHIVLSDRWIDSTIAYQGYGAGVDVRWIRELARKAVHGVEPRLTIFLELPLLVGLRRAKSFKKADRMERKAVLFHQKVRKGYLAIAKAEPRRFRKLPIRETDTIWEVSEKIRNIVDGVVR